MAGDGRFGDDAPAPYRLQQVVLADHPFVVADQQQQQVEHLRADGHDLAALGQLPALLVEHVVFKHELHGGYPLGRAPPTPCPSWRLVVVSIIRQAVAGCTVQRAGRRRLEALDINPRQCQGKSTPAARTCPGAAGTLEPIDSNGCRRQAESPHENRRHRRHRPHRIETGEKPARARP
ncbi:hypothetical protein D3C79_728960 [compost metagenome]